MRPLNTPLWWSKVKACRTQNSLDPRFQMDTLYWTQAWSHNSIRLSQMRAQFKKKRKLSWSQADLDKLDMTGHKHQDTRLCGGLTKWQGHCWDTLLLWSVEKCPCETSRHCRGRDCPDILMSSSGWRWGIGNTDLRGPSKCQQGNIMHLCFKTTAPGVRPEISFVSCLSCPQAAKQEMTKNTVQSINITPVWVS